MRAACERLENERLHFPAIEGKQQVDSFVTHGLAFHVLEVSVQHLARLTRSVWK